MHLVVGDVHGCYKAYRRLLKDAKFRPGKDKLWLTGDLVNRGPRSADVIRHVMDLGDTARTVLGNHDLHLLAVAAGVAKPKRNDNSHLILEEADAPALIDWLCRRPLAVYNDKHDFLLVHAAVHKNWTLADTLARAKEIEAVLCCEDKDGFLKNMYGDTPENWNDGLEGWDRLRLITNIFTRVRFCTPQGHIDLSPKGPPGSQPTSLYPWFEVPGRATSGQMIVFGHWSALGFYRSNNTICLDSGYLWGGRLSALKFKKSGVKLIQVGHE